MSNMGIFVIAVGLLAGLQLVPSPSGGCQDVAWDYPGV